MAINVYKIVALAKQNRSKKNMLYLLKFQNSELDGLSLDTTHNSLR